MKRSSAAVMVTIAALAAPARADQGTAPAATALAAVTGACGDEVAGARAAVVIGQTTGETVYRVTLKRSTRLISVTGGDGDPCGLPAQCTAFTAKPYASTTGRLRPSGGAATARVYPAHACLSDACPVLVAIQTGAGVETAIAAAHLPDGCSATIKARALDRRHDALHVMCSTPAGAGDHQAHLVFRARPGSLERLLSFDGGATQLASPAERADGQCTIGPVGAIAAVTIDRAPAWRITRAPDAGQSGASCKQQAAIEEDLRWDDKAGGFAPIGAPRPLTRSTCDCKR